MESRVDKSLEARKAQSLQGECCVRSTRQLNAHTVAGVKDPSAEKGGRWGGEQGLIPMPAFPPFPPGVPVPDSQAAGQQELCSQEPGSGGDTRLHLSDLL